MLLLGAFTLPAFAQTEVPNNWPLKPSGLNAGDQFRLLLVVDETKDATDTSIGSYDSFVQARISANGHGSIRAYSSSFKVLGSTTNTAARDHTGTTYTATDTGVPIYWLNGSKLADDYDDFYDGTWTNKSSVKNEAGTDADTSNSSPRVRTGSNDDGTPYSFTNSGGNTVYEALGGRGNGSGNCRAARLGAANGTLNNQRRSSTEEFRYFALSGVFEVGSATVAKIDDLQITSSAGSTSPGEYVAGDDVEFTVTFSEAVTVTGAPKLNFHVNGSSGDEETRQADHVPADSTSTELVFSYEVADTDYDHDGISLPANLIDLNGGSIRAQATASDADLGRTGTPSQAEHKIHLPPNTATSTQVISTPASAANGYVTGETIRVAVTWNRNVRAVTDPVGMPGDPNQLNGGTPTLGIMLDSSPLTGGPSFAAYSQAGSDKTLHFDHVVQPGDFDDGGLVTNSTLSFNGGFITRKEVADSIAKHIRANQSVVPLVQQTAHKVNVNRPTVSSLAVTSSSASGDTYGTGEIVKVGVTFSKAVTVDTANGTPRLEMELQSAGEGAARTRYLDYASGSGGSTLVFEYVVPVGESDDDGIKIGADSLSANGGTIRDSDGTDAVLDHSAPGTDGVYSGHKIDGGTVVAVTVSFAAASYTATEDGTDATVTVNLSADPEREVIVPIVGTGKDGGSSGDFSLAPATVTIASGSTSGTFKVRATDDDFDDDGETAELSFSGLPNGVTAGTQNTASVSITDDDTRGVVYSTESVRVDEGKRTDNIFTMALTSQPTRATLVEMKTAIFTNRDRVDMGIGDRIAVVFDGSNWNTPQPVHMISADRVEENTTLHIKPVFSRSGDRNSDYVGLTVPTVELTIVDRNKPRVDGATIDGDSLVLTYDQDLDENSVPAPGDFAVTVAGSSVTVSDVSISGKKVTLTLATAAAFGDEAAISYTVPGSNPIQDEDENAAGAIADKAVTNNTPDTTPPGLSSANIAGDTLVLAYDETLDSASTPAASAFTVTVAGSSVAVSNVSVSGKTVTLTLASEASDDDAVSLSYTVPTNNPIRDEAENTAAALTDRSVINNAGAATDATLAALSLTDGNGNAISLSPVFASGTRSYTAAVAADIDQITIVATANNGSAMVAYTPSTDAETTEDDHQVNLAFGDNTLRATVTAADGITSETYSITVTRARAAVAYHASSMNQQVTEDDTSITFTVTLTPAMSKSVVVKYATEDYPSPGDQLHGYAGEDYTAASGSLTFAANETSKTFQVPILEDSLDENNEVLFVILSLPANTNNVELSGSPTAVPLIIDDDPEPSIGIADANADEGDPVAFTASLSEVSGRDVTVDYRTSIGNGDSATSGVDFTAATAETLTIPAGATSATLSIATAEDSHYEDDETFTVTLSSPVAGTLSSDPLRAKGTIDNDDVLEQVTGVTPTVGNAKLTINWTAVAGAGGYKLQWKSGTQEYSATSSDNRQATILSGTTTSHELTGLINDTEYTVRIAATHSDTDDGAWSSEVSATPVEPDTTAPTLTLATVNGASLVLTYDEDLDANSTPATGDFSVNVAGSSITVSNVWVSGKTVTLTLATAAEYGNTVSLSYTVPASNPIQDSAGNDAAALSGQVAANNTSATTVALTLSPSSVAESAGATSMTVTGTLDGAPRAADTAVTVAVGDSGDAATEGTDYATVDDLTLTIDAGETSGTATFSLTPTDDDLDEDDEMVSVAGATAAAGLDVTPTTATIVDDDTRGVEVSTTALSMSEGGSATYTVVLTSQPTATVTVTPSVSGDSDVTVSPTSLDFTTSAWSTVQTVTVAAAHDDDFDADEATVAHSVSGGDYGANSVTASDVEVTVTDDDIPPAIVAGGVEVTSFPRATYNTYGVDETIAVSVSFDTDVEVNTTGGTPYIKVEFKNAAATATVKHFSYASGSGSATLLFEYEVQAADRDNDGFRIGSNALVLDGGTIRDTDSRDALLTHAGAGRQDGHRVDGREVVGPAELSVFKLRTADGSTVLPSSPDFDPETTAYTASVPYSTQWVAVRVFPEEGGERTILPADIVPNTSFHEVALGVGPNVITVTASRTGVPDRIYTMTVTRGKPTVTLTAAESSTTYRLEDLSFTVTRNRTIDETLDVNVAFEQDQDFLPASGLTHTVSIPANEASATLTLGTGDFTGGATADGTLTAAIAESDGYDKGAADSAGVDFVVADPALTVRFDRYAYTFLEDAGAVSLDIVAETAPGVVLSDAFSLSVLTLGDQDSAVSGSDYSLGSGGVIFRAADFAASNGALAATGSIDLTLLDDSATEGEESFWIQLSATDFPPAATLVQSDGSDCPIGGCRSKVTIVDDESPPPQVTGVKVTPGVGSLIVDWTAVAGATGYKVQWKSGTEAFSDAATDDREATLSSGATTRHTITGLTDGTAYTVRVIATRTGASGDGLASAEATGTAGLPTLTIADASATEGDAVEFTVSLSPAADQAVTVAYATSDGTATADATHEDGADYTAPASDAALIFDAGETSATISIATGADTVDEDDETFTVTLSDASSNAVLGTDKAATGTIVDDDTDPAEVTSVAFENAPTSGDYALGDVIEVSVTFDTAVEVTGAPRVQLAMSGTAASASYALYDAAASTETVLAFRRAVTGDDDDADAISVAANGLELNGASIVNKGTTVAAVLGHDAVQGGNIRTRSVEGIAVTSEPEVGAPAPEGIYGPGEEVTFTVTFAAAVTVDDSGGDPGLIFVASDGARQEAVYASGSGTTSLVFAWTVPSDVPGAEGAVEVPANTTGGGTLLSDGGLVLNGATMEDAQGRAVNIRHGDYATKAQVDTTAPVVASGASGATVAGTTLVLAFEKAAGVADHLDEGSVPAPENSAVVVAGSARTVSGVAVDGATVTLTLASAVGHAQAVTVNYTPGTDPIRDLWGNAAAGFSDRSVRNDSPEPALSIGDVTVAEDAGKATFTVTLDVVSGEAVTVDYATSDDTAEAGSDYTAASGTVSIAAGAASATFDVTVTDDSVGEADEAFTVTLSDAVNATIARAAATGTITDDETPTLTIADASATEGDAVEFTVSLSPAADQAVTVLYATSDGTATVDGAHEDGADYTAPASDAALTIAAGQTSATFSIATGNDAVFEGDETFTVTLSDPSSNAVLGSAKTATGTIENNDDASTDAALKALTLKVGGSDVDLTPVFAATTYSYEVDVANTAATVNVMAESNHGKATVAIGGDDDTTSPGKAALPMAFGENTVTVTVTAEDGDATQDYTVKVTRALPALAWDHTVYYLGEDSGEVRLTVTLTPASIDEVTVDYATPAVGSATAGEDFVATSGTLTFEAGETEKTVKVTILDDTLYEPDGADDVFVELSTPTGTAVLGKGLSGALLFMEHGDNDVPPSATMENVTVDEDAGTMEFTLSLSHGVEADGLQFFLASSGVGGTATAGADYESFLSGASATLAIPSRATSATFSVSILDDDLDEDDETITMQWKHSDLYVAE